ncbi:hypothetical protein [Leisingera methylohalidivorans]|nr:hypothetical protein [Leisingera methylohalidivorans]
MKLGEERIPPDEAEVFEALIATNLKTVWMEGTTAKRGQHGKHHGLAKGTFQVSSDLPEGFAVGVFQPGREYRCQLRFSNGGKLDDTDEDVRGMAIKLFDVEGKKLLAGRGPSTEQDFLLVDHPTYFTATMAEYLAFNRHFTPIQDMRGNGMLPLKVIRALWGLAMLSIFHRKTLKAARMFAGRQVHSILSLTFHSTTPYLFGEGRAVKYKAVGHGPKGGTLDCDNGLGRSLRDTLRQAPVTFDFGVIVQTDAIRHPIEDPTVDWEANGANFISLAKLTLEQQENSSEKDALAEKLRFNPWMALPEHRPLGFINRARGEIYRAMSNLRGRKTR